MVGRIAPYLANNVQRSYLRQQRVGDRIADARTKDKATPTVKVEISAAARVAAQEAEATASIHKAMQVQELSDRFVDLFLEAPAPVSEPEEEGNRSKRTKTTTRTMMAATLLSGSSSRSGWRFAGEKAEKTSLSRTKRQGKTLFPSPPNRGTQRKANSRTWSKTF